MKSIVDAQLPRKFVTWLNEAGHDALHTLGLPKKNLTSDMELTEVAVSQGRIVIIKDDDFVQAYLINGEPSLLLISTGNISKLALEVLIKTNLQLISDAFLQSRFVEQTVDSIVIHEQSLDLRSKKPKVERSNRAGQAMCLTGTIMIHKLDHCVQLWRLWFQIN